MNIFDYAKEFNDDYYDPGKRVIYKVQNYNNSKKLGIPVTGIEITDISGNYIGYEPEVCDN